MEQSKTTRMNQFLERTIQKGRRKRLGFFEWIALAVSGFIDGKKEAIKRKEDGEWTSSFAQKEKNGCAEAQERIIAEAQYYLEEVYEEADKVAADMIFQKKQITEHGRHLLPDLTEEQLAVKKRGEEGLSDAQTTNRRRRELERKNHEWRSRMRAAEDRIVNDYEKLSGLKAQIVQINQIVERAVEAVQSHTRQRVDYYWTVAVRSGTRASIPVVYEGFDLADVIAGFRQKYQMQEARLDEVMSIFNTEQEVA